MILTRKLLVPTLLLFAALLAGLFAYFFSSLHAVYHEAEEGDLASFSSAFSAEVENQKKLALALAAEVAGNPGIQNSLARREKQELLGQVTPGMSAMKDVGSNIVIYQFHLPDGSLFLDVLDPDPASSAEVATSPIVVHAIENQTAVAGLESDHGMLGIKGIMPIYKGGVFIGSVEIGIGLNKSMLAALKGKYGGEWHILLANDNVGIDQSAEGPDPEFTIYATTQSSPLFNAPESYNAALEGEPTITHPSVSGRDYAIQSEPLRDYSGRIIGVLDILYDHTHISATQNTRLLAAGLISILVLILGTATLTILTRRTLQPIQTLTQAAADITGGNAVTRITIDNKEDEISILVRAFNQMTSDLQGSIIDLEQRVAERTQDLESQTLRLRVAAEIARDALSAQDLGSLLERATQLILDRFHLYHVGIFLLDANREFAILTASPTQAGKNMVAEKFMVSMGDPNLVGRVAASGESKINPDAGRDAGRVSTHLLPDAKSDMAIPLKADQRILGVLNIQSDKQQAFNQNDLTIMQILADQLATAIEKTRLAQEVSRALEELERSYGRYTREGWQNLSSSGRIKNRGYRFDNVRIEPAKIPPTLGVKAMSAGTLVTSNDDAPSHEVAIPIKLRGQTVGAVQAKLREGSGDGTINSLELVIDRLASALESARLYEQASYRADREQAISQITNAISSSSDYETIMRTTVRELGSILEDADVAIQILNENDSGNSAD